MGDGVATAVGLAGAGVGGALVGKGGVDTVGDAAGDAAKVGELDATVGGGVDGLDSAAVAAGGDPGDAVGVVPAPGAHAASNNNSMESNASTRAAGRLLNAIGLPNWRFIFMRCRWRG